MFNKFVATVFIALALLSIPALAAKHTVTIHKAHARPSINGIGIAYFTATSTGNDAITGVTSACCKAVELHRSEKINGIMSMRRIANLSLKKGKPTLVQPESEGGEHMMLLGLKKPIAEGDAVNVTFTFEKAPPQTVSFPVMAPKVSGDSHAHH